MRGRRRHPWRLALVLAAFVLAACGGNETEEMPSPQMTESGDALRVTDVNLGSSIDADRVVFAPTSSFAPTDTIYASVETEGTDSGATLTARWRYEDGQVVDETSQSISPTGSATTEFHISMPNGLPSGDYTVEILLNGESVATESFEVE